MARITLEAVLTNAAAFGLETASPTQRGICRIIDGLPLGDLADNPNVEACVGGKEAVAHLPQSMPLEIYLLAAIRSGKSLLAAALAFKASQTCNLSRLRPGEVPCVYIVSTSKKQATAVRDHLIGTIQTKPALRELLVEEPTGESVRLRHPSGRPVEIMVVAGARAGSSLISRWAAGVIFDEFPRMLGAEDGVINFDDARRAVLGRLLPGAQLIGIGSPWAPFGPAYRICQEHFGRPTKGRVVIRATGPMMYPALWTPEYCEKLRQTDPIVWRTDGLGEFADAEASFFQTEEVERATRPKPVELPPEPGVVYGAAMDPATRGNGWTLAVTRLEWGAKGPRTVVVLARQWIGSSAAPLSPDAVLGQIAGVLKPYKVDVISTDQWAADALKDIAFRYKLALKDEAVTSARKTEMFDSLHSLISDDRLELPPLPELASDLRRVRRVVNQHGITVDLPRTSDGRHCDYASVVALATTIPLPMPTRAEDKPPEDPGDAFERVMIEAHKNEMRSAENPLDKAQMDLEKLDEYATF